MSIARDVSQENVADILSQVFPGCVSDTECVAERHTDDL